VLLGNATLSSASSLTDANGYATTTVQVVNMSGNVRVNACVAPANTSCSLLTITPVTAANLKLTVVGGSAQMVAVGQPFQPVAVRVTDSSSPWNPVQGASVDFSMLIMRPDNDVFLAQDPEGVGGNHGMPVILGSSQASILTDSAGLASVLPTAGSLPGMIEIEIVATTGVGATQFFELESIWPVNLVSGNTPFSMATCSTATSCDNETLGVKPSSQLPRNRKLDWLD
jgi:hypothetical protein